MTEVSKKKGAKYILASILLAGFVVLLIPSCVHEPLITPIDNPVDTTGNPIDTTGNPVDTSTGTPCDPNVVYFTKDILPLFISTCAKSGCHNTASHKEGIVMDNFQNVMGSHIIKANDANNSKLIKSIKATGGEDRMPPSPAQRFTTGQIALISKWINQGAKDLTCDENAGQCVTTNVSYAGFVAPLLSTYCVGCHSGGAPSGGIPLSTYANVKAMATSGRLYGSIAWSTGFKTMPQGSTKLSQCSIDKIKGWIDEGANNN
ncbi:MAG: c-type cytochrome domain-containing protein [Saprospiraceae bacterium]